MKCKYNNITDTVIWKYINKAWLPAVTVCSQRLYAPSVVPSNESCDDGQFLCDGVCVELMTDRGNCGDCGLQCEEGQECVAGVCMSPP